MDLAKGPLRSIRTYSGYYVNGYKFYTIKYGDNKSTMNSGVCIKGSNNNVDELDYYGQLNEIIQLEYPALPIKRTVLFKCRWFDPTPTLGMRVHKQYNLVDVHRERSYNRYEPFVLAAQSTQVYYTKYPSLKKNAHEWWAVCKIKARSIVEVPESSERTLSSHAEAFQVDDVDVNEISIHLDEGAHSLVDPSGLLVDIDGEEVDEDEPELEVPSNDEEEFLDEEEFSE